MPPAPTRDQTKAQPMSISQLCHSDTDTSPKEGLEQDPLTLDDDIGRFSSPDPTANPNGCHYTHSDDEFEELDDPRPKSTTVSREDEQIAVEALGSMANGSRPLSSSSAMFMSRVSSLPLVNSAIKAYETGKQNSAVMKYGANLVESGVKTLSKPVLDKLDKVYPTRSDVQVLPSPTNSARSSNDIVRPENINGNGPYLAYRSRGDSIDSSCSSSSSRPSVDVLRSRGSRQEDVTLRQRSDSQSSQRSFQYSNGYYPQQQQQRSQVATHSSTHSSSQFSGWRGVVATVGTASAAGVAIFSEESMKSLKYCLQWLEYAVQHIEHQIGLLRQFLASLVNPSQSTAMIPSNAASTLASIKNEVVETLRKVIDVVSRYAGACLPEQAKFRVREFILSMPARWQSINNESAPSTPLASPSLGPQSDRTPEQLAALGETSSRATKVLSFANESSDMLRSVAFIFKDSVDKAENWMDKLRYVGMNPQNNTDGLPSWAPTGFPGTPGAPGMPGTFPGFGNAAANGTGNGLEQYSLRQTQTQQPNGHAHANGNGSSGSPTRSLKSSPRMNSRENFHAHRHAYRQKPNMSGDEDSGSDEEELMDDSDDEAVRGHAPLKRTATHTQGNPVRRRKTKGESDEVVASLISSNGVEGIKQESN
ncbi:hypothetical protein BGX34_003690 [Mortierella sp. NVP85]|nr:hypothetical protein BGX34_003690 [Mortierella sp. NVP85]